MLEKELNHHRKLDDPGNENKLFTKYITLERVFEQAKAENKNLLE